jgi:hypothetical protein
MKKGIVFLLVLVVALVFGVAVAGAERVAPERGLAGFDLTFDSYSDGMSLSTANQATTLVTGTHCGSLSGNVMGSKTLLPMDARVNAAVMTDTGDGTSPYGGYTTYLGFDHTFEIWDSAGLINSGTWSFGCPAPLTEGSSAFEGSEKAEAVILDAQDGLAQRAVLSFDFGTGLGVTLSTNPSNTHVTGALCGSASDAVHGHKGYRRVTGGGVHEIIFNDGIGTGGSIGGEQFIVRLQSRTSGTWEQWDASGMIASGAWTPGCPEIPQ